MTAHSFTNADYHDFVNKKMSCVREYTAYADNHVFTDTEDSRKFDFNQSAWRTLFNIIKDAPLKQCSLNPLPMWLLKDSAMSLGLYILLMVNSSVVLVYFMAGWKHVIMTPSFQAIRSRWIGTVKLSSLTFLSKVLKRVRWPSIYFRTTYFRSFSQLTGVVAPQRAHCLRFSQISTPWIEANM